MDRADENLLKESRFNARLALRADQIPGLNAPGVIVRDTESKIGSRFNLGAANQPLTERHKNKASCLAACSILTSFQFGVGADHK